MGNEKGVCSVNIPTLKPWMSLVAATGVHDGEPTQNSRRYKSSNNAVGEEFGEWAKLAMKGFPDKWIFISHIWPTRL